MIKVIKRDCTYVDFDKEKIYNAIVKAMKSNGGYKPSIANNIANEIEDKLLENNISEIDIYTIENIVYEKLLEHKQNLTAKAYTEFRAIREFQRDRDNTIDNELSELLSGTSEYWANENSNKNAKEVTVQRDYMAGIVSTDITRRYLLPPDIVQAHDDGIIHFHDADYYGQKTLHNCCLINLEDMLQNGTVVNEIMIEKPHRFITACTVATQIITAVASSQYGGCSINLAHLAPFVRDSFFKHYVNGCIYVDKKDSQWLQENVYDYLNDKDCFIEEQSMFCEHWKEISNNAYKYAIEMTKKEVKDGVQTFNYQINSMSTTNGQSPFLSVFMYLNDAKEYKKELAMIIEEFLIQRIEGMKNEKGVYITQAFPKLLYVLEKDNITEDSPYWYLTELSAKCSAKRLVPDYISEKKMLELKGDCYACMGCRSFLTTDRATENLSNSNNYTKGHKYWGRFNQGVVTINLPDIALSSNRDEEVFWQIFDERMELCHRALRCRHERLLGTLSDVAPIQWQHGALARLKKHEPIDKLLYDGYSTISLGYAGLYECVKYMTGQSHTNSDKGKPFGLKVMQFINDKCNEWKKAENIDYSPYGSPIESTTYKFAKCLKARFGVIEGITDRDYITNSYHVPVFEEINAFDKLKLESEFQELSGGGAISYIEMPNVQNNVKAVLKVIKFIYDNIMYAEMNTKSDYCQKCGYDGEMLIDENMEWYCPQCGNRDHDTMNVTRRTCGYLGSNFWNKGRTQEIKERVLHLDNHEYSPKRSCDS